MSGFRRIEPSTMLGYNMFAISRMVWGQAGIVRGAKSIAWRAAAALQAWGLVIPDPRNIAAWRAGKPGRGGAAGDMCILFAGWRERHVLQLLPLLPCQHLPSGGMLAA